MKNSFCLAVLLALAGGIQAGIPEAKAAYLKASAKEKIKDYSGAAADYEAALQAAPEYYYAHKQLGTCYYYLGDKAKSLSHYEDYLKAQPNDAGVTGLVARMKAQAPAASAVSAAAPGTAAPEFHSRFGVRLGAGWGFGISGYGVSQDVSTGGGYPLSPGSGLLYGGEILYGFHPSLELGLAVYPMGYSGTYASKLDLTNDKKEDASTVAFSSIPAIVMLYSRLPLGPKSALVAGIGLGYALGGVGTEHIVRKENYGLATTTTTDSSTGLDSALAYRAVVGSEFSFTKAWSLFYGLTMDSASFGRSSYDYKSQTLRDSDGKMIQEVVSKTTYSGNGGKKTDLTSNFTSTSSGGTTTTVFTQEGGNFKEVHTTITSSSGTVDKFEYTYKAAKTDTLDVNRIALAIGVTMRF